MSSQILQLNTKTHLFGCGMTLEAFDIKTTLTLTDNNGVSTMFCDYMCLQDYLNKCPPDVDVPIIADTMYCSKANCGCRARDERKIIALGEMNMNE